MKRVLRAGGREHPPLPSTSRRAGNDPQAATGGSPRAPSGSLAARHLRARKWGRREAASGSALPPAGRGPAAREGGSGGRCPEAGNGARGGVPRSILGSSVVMVPQP